MAEIQTWSKTLSREFLEGFKIAVFSEDPFKELKGVLRKNRSEIHAFL